uniref:NADH-ubiquinone oxidoreductase chain 1 n=1 Tax=Ceutorhynchus albosuturalis TaxID=342699 RepID=A0AA51NHZ2_9CUCU|nr:NADH dehydrogenase subunit 1 [Ceutorhynchus albosuturalis]
MIQDFLLTLFSTLVLLICILVSMSFYTLMERKVLGYIHIRKGPNKLGFNGLLQPFSDAIKLFSKEQSYSHMSNYNLFYFCPIVNMFTSLLLWICMPFSSVLLNFNLSMLFFLSVSSLGVYSIMLAGWSSNSNYAMLGSLRAVAQSISYEVSLVLIMISFLFMIFSFNFFELSKYQELIWFLFLFLPMSIMWVVSSLAETNRSPFDFAESESELVSGFNIEYSSGGFALIFMAEYTSILFMCVVCSLLFMGANFYNFMFFIKISFLAFFWIWVRGTLPRYRYDKLMYLSWKIYLPVSLNMVLFYFNLSMFIYSFFI